MSLHSAASRPKFLNVPSFSFFKPCYLLTLDSWESNITILNNFLFSSVSSSRLVSTSQSESAHWQARWSQNVTPVSCWALADLWYNQMSLPRISEDRDLDWQDRARTSHAVPARVSGGGLLHIRPSMFCFRIGPLTDAMLSLGIEGLKTVYW